MNIKTFEKLLGCKFIKENAFSYYNYGSAYRHKKLSVEYGIYTVEGGHYACCDITIHDGSRTKFNEVSHKGFGCTSINKAKSCLVEVKSRAFKKTLDYYNKIQDGKI